MRQTWDVSLKVWQFQGKLKLLKFLNILVMHFQLCYNEWSINCEIIWYIIIIKNCFKSYKTRAKLLKIIWYQRCWLSHIPKNCFLYKMISKWQCFGIWGTWMHISNNCLCLKKARDTWDQKHYDFHWRNLESSPS